ncbi:hypothetical protein, partial [Alkalihalophilus marmarensis]|uniref:hypothetical protein n=1 Tax=Alkalihalophilus marmarensis TaxID=521377 RepID=UPI002E2416A7|nr:hypothetical protein [Alkalihalophilus marmarensis]
EHQTTIQQHAGLISEKASLTVVDTINDKVSTVEASVETIAGQVSLKANAEEVYTKSEVNTELGKKVDTTVYNSQMTQLDVKVDGVTADIRSVQSEVSDVDSRLVSAQTQLNMQAGLIDAKAERSELTTVDGRVTGVRNDLTTLQVSHTGLNSTVSSLRSDLDGLEIGGRNLIVRANELADKWLGVDGSIGNGTGFAVMNEYIPVIPGQTFTFSKDVGTSNDYWRWNWYGENREFISRRPDNRNEFQWTVPNGAYYIRVSYPMNKSPKLEKGNKATDWTPAPEDVDSAIYTIEEFASRIDQKADSIAT